MATNDNTDKSDKSNKMSDEFGMPKQTPYKRLGVVLAGGKASRMPNKPLLPLPDGSFLCKSALDYLTGQKVDHIVVVIGEEDLPLRRVLRLAIGEQGVSYLADPCTGIVNALSCVAVSYPLAEQLVVVCCDNVYPMGECVYGEEGIVCRAVTQGLDHLDQWDIKKRIYVERGTFSSSSFAITTPWILSAARFRGDLGTARLLRFFNNHKIPATIASAVGWADLGTESSYYEYWNDYKVVHKCGGSQNRQGLLWQFTVRDETTGT